MAAYFYTTYITKQQRCECCRNIYDVQEEIEEYSDGFKQITDVYYPNGKIYNINGIKHFQELNSNCYYKLSEDKNINIFHNINNCNCDIIKMRCCILNFYEKDLVLFNCRFNNNNSICETCILDLMSDNICINLDDYFNMNIVNLFSNLNI